MDSLILISSIPAIFTASLIMFAFGPRMSAGANRALGATTGVLIIAAVVALLWRPIADLISHRHQISISTLPIFITLIAAIVIGVTVIVIALVLLPYGDRLPERLAASNALSKIAVSSMALLLAAAIVMMLMQPLIADVTDAPTSVTSTTTETQKA